MKKSHNQEHENEVTPSTAGKRHAEYSLKDIQSIAPTLTGQPLILGNRQHAARNTPSRILRFSSVPTSFIVTTFWGVGGLDELKKEWFRVALPIMSAFVLCGCFLSWWTGCCMIVYTGGTGTLVIPSPNTPVQ
jgi:hypothetical protein